VTDTERDELVNAIRDALQREQDALLNAAAARQETKHAKILAVTLIAALWLAIAYITYTLIWGIP
jgi:uncharacterized membrane protein YukC